MWFEENMKIICQEKSGWCGVACVQEVLRRKGIYRSQENIATDMQVGYQGIDPDEIFNVIKYTYKLGVAMIEHESLDDLGESHEAGYSVIVDWMNGRNDEDGHYALLEYVDKDCVILNDPDYPGSLRMLKRETFEKQWYDYEDGKKIERLAILV